MKKYIFIIAIIILVALSFLFFQPQPESPKDDIVSDEEGIEVLSIEKPKSFEGMEMTTYKSPYEYEITHPKEWVVNKAPERTGLDFRLEEFYVWPKEIPYGPPPVLQIEVYRFSLSQYLARIDMSMNDLSRIILNDINGYKHKTFGGYSYIFANNNKIYRIIYRFNSEYEISQQEALWVLSTFRLTDSEPSPQ